MALNSCRVNGEDDELLAISQAIMHVSQVKADTEHITDETGSGGGERKTDFTC